MTWRVFSLGALTVWLAFGDLPGATEAQPLPSLRRIGVLLVLLSPTGQEAHAFRQCPAFETVNRACPLALYVIDCPPFFTHRTTLLRLAAKARLPVISGERRYVDDGALISARLLGITISESIMLRADEVIR